MSKSAVDPAVAALRYAATVGVSALGSEVSLVVYLLLFLHSLLVTDSSHECMGNWFFLGLLTNSLLLRNGGDT